MSEIESDFDKSQIIEVTEVHLSISKIQGLWCAHGQSWVGVVHHALVLWCMCILYAHSHKGM